MNFFQLVTVATITQIVLGIWTLFFGAVGVTQIKPDLLKGKQKLGAIIKMVLRIFRLRFVVISAIVAICLLLATFFIFPPILAKLAVPTDFSVTNLRPGQSVKQGVPIRIKGICTSMGSGKVWVALEDGSGQFYLQSPPISFMDSESWIAHNIVPRQGITAVDFVSVTSQGDATFQNMVDTKAFGAFLRLPDGSVMLQSIPIVIS